MFDASGCTERTACAKAQPAQVALVKPGGRFPGRKDRGAQTDLKVELALAIRHQINGT